jgi:endonuclease-8
MFGTYRINEEKVQPISLNLTFKNGSINFYACSVKILEGDVNTHYDFSSDVMSSEWNPAKAKLKKIPDEMV